MQELSLETMEAVIETAVKDRLCVQAWLGHGDVLFLGFGEQILPPVILGKAGTGIKQPKPPYQIRTDLANWWIEDRTGILGSSYDDERAWEAASFLVGRRASKWQFLHPTWGLHVELEGEVSLKIEPYTTSDDPDGDAWSVRDPDGFYSHITRNGRIYRVHGDEVPV